MSFLLSPEQTAIEKMCADFVREQIPVDQLRQLRDQHETLGFFTETWRKMAELGFCGMRVDETWGGLGLGYVELGLVMEQLGRHLAATPMLSTAIIAAEAIQSYGDEEQRQSYLPRISAGQCILSLAMDESTRFDPYFICTSATRKENSWTLSGDKTFVMDGDCAEAFLIVARSGGGKESREGLTIFLVPRDSVGLTVVSSRSIDSRLMSKINLNEVQVSADAIVGEVGSGANILDDLIEGATVLLCAEMLGSLQSVFEQTLAYLKERKQFGVAIGSFQGLQHRAAKMFCEIELCKSVLREALCARDGKTAEAALLMSVCKARCTDTFLLLANEAIQMHGGMGVTDELDIGFYLKRARVCEAMFGDAAYHRARFASLSGF